VPPVLFLTTLVGIGDRVAGLEAGGDDYLVIATPRSRDFARRTDSRTWSPFSASSAGAFFG
jgi:hypothetical protein